MIEFDGSELRRGTPSWNVAVLLLFGDRSRGGIALRGLLPPGTRAGRAAGGGAPSSLPRWPRQALPAHWLARAGAGAPDHRDDDVPREGHDVLAGEGGGGDARVTL